jgi:GH35 family endo-1,4-beta-xylanase
MSGFTNLYICALTLVAALFSSSAFSKEIKKEYFGIHMFYPAGEIASRGTTPSAVPDFFGSWRLHTAEKLTWRDMAPMAGSKLDFRIADAYMNIAAQHNMRVLWTLGSSTPQWAAANPGAKALSGLVGSSSTPSSEADWLSYVQQVLARYPNKIEAIEIWNEPDTTDGKWVGHSYNGTMRQLVSLTCTTFKAVKKINPSILVVSPSFTGDEQVDQHLEKFFSLGGGKCIDVLGFHSYEYQGSGPGYLTMQVARVRKIVSKHGFPNMPLWNTEFGVLVQNMEGTVKPMSKWGGLNKVHPEKYSASIATQYLMWGAAAGLDRFYWFAWDSQSMGLTRKGRRTMNIAGTAIKAIVKWTVGQPLPVCSELKNSASRQCLFGKKFKIIWPEERMMLPDGYVAENILGEKYSGPRSLVGDGLPVKINSDSTKEVAQ